MDISKTLVAIGFGLIVLGGVVRIARHAPWLYSWFGNLPGDIRYQSDRAFVYAPIVSMLVVSVVVSIVLGVIQRIGR
jgi:hypothetical protein